MSIPAPFVSSWTTIESLSGVIFPEAETRWAPIRNVVPLFLSLIIKNQAAKKNNQEVISDRDSVFPLHTYLGTLDVNLTRFSAVLPPRVLEIPPRAGFVIPGLHVSPDNGGSHSQLDSKI